jgi:hypothetical protein
VGVALSLCNEFSFICIKKEKRKKAQSFTFKFVYIYSTAGLSLAYSNSTEVLGQSHCWGNYCTVPHTQNPPKSLKDGAVDKIQHLQRPSHIHPSAKQGPPPAHKYRAPPPNSRTELARGLARGGTRRAEIPLDPFLGSPP